MERERDLAILWIELDGDRRIYNGGSVLLQMDVARRSVRKEDSIIWVRFNRR